MSSRIVYILLVGNNDGSMNGVKYFTCPQNYGAFVPVHDIKQVVPKRPLTVSLVCPHNIHPGRPTHNEAARETSFTIRFVNRQDFF